WETKQPGESAVEFGTSAKLGETLKVSGSRTLHHVEIPLSKQDTTYHYRVKSGTQISGIATFKSYPTKELRVALVADWGFAKPDLTALKKDDIHLLLTAGDNVPSLHQFCGSGATNCTKAFSALIDSQPGLFRSTPFLPALGNHDREIRPRGPKPPAEAVYDTNALAYRTFFELPGDEWKWTFDFPAFDARFIALDLNHIQDIGTTWQTCHALAEGSEQLKWYEDTMNAPKAGHIITIYNEKNSAMRAQVKGKWGQLIQKGSLAITGFGYFAERAEVDGFSYYNTALKGNGDKYPDPKSAFLASEHSYILLTFKKDTGELIVALKALDGRVLDQKAYPKRKP
ncbi:MAG: hypothetical protein K0Q55_2095, partial [Verrucomicrobia bacterium]|nr:hypothetical protein [Verrucomicrobiota bacterium]